MNSKWYWQLLELTRKLWFRVSLFGILAVITALVSIAIKSYIPVSASAQIGADAVDNLLNILASSMLAVTTFSLNIMVSANNSAASNVTPRATSLLTEDRTTQNTLATFIGSFVFSLVGIIALTLGAYGEEGRTILFIVTLFIITLIIITLIRWIQHLSNLGNVGETTNRVEKATVKALTQRMNNPYMGGKELREDMLRSKELIPVYVEKFGYIRHIDVCNLSLYAEKNGCHFYIPCLPGHFIHANKPIVFVRKSTHEFDENIIAGYFTIGPERAFDEDPRFGLSVLSEIASRSLPPSINDSGTAIDIINRGVRILSCWRIGKAPSKDDNQVKYPCVYLFPLILDDLFDDLFSSIARDGASLFEVQIKLQKAYLALIRLDAELYGEPVARHARIALLRSESMLFLDEEKERLRNIVKKIADCRQAGTN